MTNEQAAQLFQQYLDDTISPEDYLLLRTWIADPAHEAALDGLIRMTMLQLPSEAPVMANLDEMFAGLSRKKPLRVQWRRIAAVAAAVLLLVSVGGYFIFREPTPAATAQQPVLPGTNKATLTLADGSILTLDSTGNNSLQQDIATVHQQGGQLTYNAQSTASSILTYNILHTPRGGQYHITLADGTSIWLNAESTLRYPAAFGRKERIVEVSGEAYFEVAPNASAPFRVKINGGEPVDVLGTSFNINAYANEDAIRATLLRGSIKIKENILKPGQQATLSASGITIENEVDVAQVTAWKNGLFSFHKTSFASVMRQLSRWYDVEVIYEGKIPDLQMEGKMDRNLQLSEVLEFLQEEKVQFRIAGKQLIVTI